MAKKKFKAMMIVFLASKALYTLNGCLRSTVTEAYYNEGPEQVCEQVRRKRSTL